MAIALEPGQSPDGRGPNQRFWRWVLRKEMHLIRWALRWTNKIWRSAPWRSALLRKRAEVIKRWHRGQL